MVFLQDKYHDGLCSEARPGPVRHSWHTGIVSTVRWCGWCTLMMGACSSQMRLLHSWLRMSVAHTRRSLPAEYTVVKLSLTRSAQTPSSCILKVEIQRCWPRDHSFMVPSELPEITCSITHTVNMIRKYNLHISIHAWRTYQSAQRTNSYNCNYSWHETETLHYDATYNISQYVMSYTDQQHKQNKW